jgi:hypothetical protein
MRAMTYYHRGDFVAARELFEQCLLEPAHRQAWSALAAEDPYCTAMGYRSRGKTRGRQGGRGWVATNSGRYGMAGLPGTASLEPR